MHFLTSCKLCCLLCCKLNLKLSACCIKVIISGCCFHWSPCPIIAEFVDYLNLSCACCCILNCKNTVFFSKRNTCYTEINISLPSVKVFFTFPNCFCNNWSNICSLICDLCNYSACTLEEHCLWSCKCFSLCCCKLNLKLSANCIKIFISVSGLHWSPCPVFAKLVNDLNLSCAGCCVFNCKNSAFFSERNTCYAKFNVIFPVVKIFWTFPDYLFFWRLCCAWWIFSLAAWFISFWAAVFYRFLTWRCISNFSNYSAWTLKEDSLWSCKLCCLSFVKYNLKCSALCIEEFIAWIWYHRSPCPVFAKLVNDLNLSCTVSVILNCKNSVFFSKRNTCYFKVNVCTPIAEVFWTCPNNFSFSAELVWSFISNLCNYYLLTLKKEFIWWSKECCLICCKLELKLAVCTHSESICAFSTFKCCPYPVFTLLCCDLYLWCWT